MRLKKLHLQNYRLHSDSTVDVGDATFILVRGRNMSGKSSIIQAIAMNLTQTAMGLDSTGKEFRTEIADGHTKAIVTADIQGQHLIENTMTLNANTMGRVASCKVLDTVDDKTETEVLRKFKNFLAERKDALLVSVLTDYLFELEEKEQKNIIAKIILPSHYDFPKDKVEAVGNLLGMGVIDFYGEPFEVITNSYKKLYKERETVNRQCKEFVIPDSLPAPKGVDSASLQSELMSIRGERSKLQSERDAAVAKANEVEVKRGKLQTKIEGLRANLTEGNAKLETLKATILNTEDVNRLTDIAAKADALKGLKDQHAGILATIRATTAQVNRLKEISDQGATCITCDQSIDAPKIAGIVSELKKEIADADQLIQKIDKQIEAIGDVQAAKDSLQKHEDSVTAIADLENKLVEIVASGKSTKVELEGLSAKSDATLPFNDPLGTLQAREDKINEQLRPVIAAEERAKEIDRLTQQKNKLVAKAATLDGLVKFFGKDGIKADLISQYIGGFESKLFEVMGAFGYSCTLSLDPWAFEVTTKRGYRGGIKKLSGAEKHIFKAAFQTAVSIAAGIRLVAIDQVEDLGEDIRGFLYECILSLVQDGSLDQAFMVGFSVDKKLPPANRRAPGSKYFYVEDGTVEMLG